MKRAFISIVIVAFLAQLSGCFTRSKEDIIESDGTVVYLNFEGGFFGIVADDNTHYDPINLPTEFQVDSLRVHFRGVIQKGYISYHMWGDTIELIDIRRLNQTNVN